MWWMNDVNEKRKYRECVCEICIFLWSLISSGTASAIRQGFILFQWTLWYDIHYYIYRACIHLCESRVVKYV